MPQLVTYLHVLCSKFDAACGPLSTQVPVGSLWTQTPFFRILLLRAIVALLFFVIATLVIALLWGKIK